MKPYTDCDGKDVMVNGQQLCLYIFMCPTFTHSYTPMRDTASKAANMAAMTSILYRCLISAPLGASRIVVLAQGHYDRVRGSWTRTCNKQLLSDSSPSLSHHHAIVKPDITGITRVIHFAPFLHAVHCGCGRMII